MDRVRRLSRQANDGLIAYLRGGRITSNDWDEDDDDEDETDEFEDYYETLVTRGAARAVLTVHVKNCTDFKSLSVKRRAQSFLRISIGEKVKCSHLQPYKDPKSSENKIAITFDEWMYFSIRIPKQGEKLMEHDLNVIVLELIFFEPGTGIPKLMGKTTVKLLEVLNKERMTMHLDLKLSRQVICKLELDLVITYGTFGYGYSHQLKHPNRSMESFVDRSLFLRCPPPLERRDAHYNVLTPHPMPYVDLIGSLLNRDTNGADAQNSNHVFPQKLMDLLQRRGRLHQLHETFESYDSQADVLRDLEKMIHKRGLQTSSSWRQHRKTKKASSKGKNKASLIPKLLGFGADSRTGSTQGNTMRTALLAATRNAQRTKAHREDMEEPITATADPRPDPSSSPQSLSPHPLSPGGVLDPPSPAPLFSPGESLPWAVDAASVPTAHQTEGEHQHQMQQRHAEETLVWDFKSLALGSQKPSTSSSRDSPLATSPGQAALPGTATSGGLGAGAPSGFNWDKLMGTVGTHNQTDMVYPCTSAPRELDPARPGAGLGSFTDATKPNSAPSGPVWASAGLSQHQLAPHARNGPSKPAAPWDDPIQTWLHAPSSIPSLNSVFSEADLQPIRNNLVFPQPTSNQSPEAAGSTSVLTGGHRSKPGRDRLKTQDGTGNPYRRPSLPR